MYVKGTKNKFPLYLQNRIFDVIRVSKPGMIKGKKEWELKKENHLDLLSFTHSCFCFSIRFSLDISNLM